MVLNEFDDRVILSNGDVIAKHDLIIKILMNGGNLENVPFFDEPELVKYHEYYENDRKPYVLEDDLPPLKSYEWNIPLEYENFDIKSYCMERLPDPSYEQRLLDELNYINNNDDMRMFICSTKYIIDTFDRKKVIRGVGRGSSCASLVLFLLGVNLVDPVIYNIDMKEFYK